MTPPGLRLLWRQSAAHPAGVLHQLSLHRLPRQIRIFSSLIVDQPDRHVHVVFDNGFGTYAGIRLYVRLFALVITLSFTSHPGLVACCPLVELIELRNLKSTNPRVRTPPGILHLQRGDQRYENCMVVEKE